MISELNFINFLFFFYLISLIAPTSSNGYSETAIFFSLQPNSEAIPKDVFYHNRNIKILISNTSESNPFIFDLSSYAFNSTNSICISFHSDTYKQFIILKNQDLFNNVNFSFNFVSVIFTSPNITFQNLTLFESPLYLLSGKINLTVGSFKTDYASIPYQFISNAFVINDFTLIQNFNSLSNHCPLTFSSNCKQSIEESSSFINHSQDFFNNDKQPKLLWSNGVNENDESDGSYILNQTVTGITIYETNVTVLHDYEILDTLFFDENGNINISISSARFTLTNYNNNIINCRIHLEFHLLTEAIVIFDYSWGSISDTVLNNVVFYHDKNVRVTFTTNLNEVPYITVSPIDNVRYIPYRPSRESYCLCLESRFESCINNRECQLYSVPISNYISSSNETFSMAIANSKASTINLYLTYSSSTDFHKFTIYSPSRGPQTLNFISVIKDIGVKLHLSEFTSNVKNLLTVSCVDIQILLITFDRSSIVDTLQLKTSTLFLTKDMYINTLITDSDSLIESQNEKITVIKQLFINKTQLIPLGVNIILRDLARLQIQDISLMPHISIRQTQIAFSHEDNEMSIDYTGSLLIDIIDASNEFPLIYLRTDMNINNDINVTISFYLVHSLSINFEEAIPFPNGFHVNFMPNDEKMTSLELILPFILNSDPHFHLFPFTTIKGNISLILTSPQTVLSFIEAAQRDNFDDMQVRQLEIDVYDSLKQINIGRNEITATIQLDEIHEYTIGFNRVVITKQLILVTNSTKVINVIFNNTQNSQLSNTFINAELLDGDQANTAENLTYFKLKTTGSYASLHFDESFEPFINYRGISTIQIQHGKNNLALKTELEVIPMAYIEDDVAGVLFYANQTEFNVSSSSVIDIHDKSELNDDESSIFTNATTENYRSGPNISVYINSPDIFLLQSEFLSEFVKFTGEPFFFITKEKSQASYAFENIQSLTIVPYELFLKSIEQSQQALPILWSKETNAIDDLISIQNDDQAKNNSNQHQENQLINRFDLLKLNKKNKKVILYRKALGNSKNRLNKQDEMHFLNLLHSLQNSTNEIASFMLNLNRNYTQISTKKLFKPLAQQKNYLIRASNFTTYMESLKSGILNLTDEYLLNEFKLELSNYSFSALSVQLTKCPIQFTTRLKYNNKTNLLNSVSSYDSNEMMFLFNYFESDVKSLHSIQSSSFVSGIFVINDEDLINVSINENKILCCSWNRNEIVELNKSITSSYFVIYYNLNEKFDVSLKSKEIVSKYFFVINSNQLVYIHLDRSWDGVKNAENVIFIVMNSSISILIETELREMPNIHVVDFEFNNLSYVEMVYNPSFTVKMGFLIFIWIASVIAIISIVFLFINCLCPLTVTKEHDKYFIDINDSVSTSSPSEHSEKVEQIKHSDKPKHEIKRKHKKYRTISSIDDRMSLIEMSSESQPIVTQSVSLSGLMKTQYSENDVTPLNSVIIDDDINKNSEVLDTINKLEQYSTENDELASGENEQSSDFDHDELYNINQK